MRLLKKQAGFTLIELMVTLAVLGVLASIALPNFQDFMLNSKIRATAESIRSGLQVARSEAVNRNVPVRFTLNNDTSWVVSCTNPDVCQDIQKKPAKEGASSLIVLKKTGGDSVSFSALGSPVSGGLTRVDVTSSASKFNPSVRLVAGGGVKVCDPSVTVVGDARKC